jgi:predicted metal-dependent peptidase
MARAKEAEAGFRSEALRVGAGVSGQRPEGRKTMPKAKATKKEKLGVKIVLEITGHMQRGEVDQFMASLSSVVNNHLENGGNGGG